MNNQFVLVWHNGTKAFPITQGTAQICQHKRTQVKNMPQYKTGMILLRTAEGFKANPNWQPIKQLTKSKIWKQKSMKITPPFKTGRTKN